MAGGNCNGLHVHTDGNNNFVCWRMINPDLDGDGKVTVEELQAADGHDKFLVQKNIAIAAFAFMVVLTVSLCTPIINESRVTALSGLISTMYVALASVVGAFMGFSAWMTKK